LTGTAAWNYTAITQWILGIRPTFDGLEVAPVIPREWGGFKAVRQFRGATYEIVVQRKGQGNQLSLLVDGEPLEGTLIPMAAGAGSKVIVSAIIS
jgi:cellobiose phosphorylase